MGTGLKRAMRPITHQLRLFSNRLLGIEPELEIDPAPFWGFSDKELRLLAPKIARTLMTVRMHNKPKTDERLNMHFIQMLIHPRQTWRNLRYTYRIGRRHRGLIETDFCSGLQDSAWLLYSIVRSVKPEVCVEIGSARGKSACCMGTALAENNKGKLFAIDPHRRTDWNDDYSVDTYEIMRANIDALNLGNYVEIIRKTSAEAAEAWSRSIDLLFIDGDHSYEGVKRDWDSFSPHVSPFGVVVFHDTIWDVDTESWSQYRRADMGVPRFVEELRQAGYPVITFPKDCGTSLVQPRIGGIPLSHASSSTALAQ